MEEQIIFSPTFPANPEFFVNRREVIDSFGKALSRSQKSKIPTPDNIAILGDWGIGKSSTLRKFEHIALHEFKGRKVFSAIIELVPGVCESFSTFTRKVIEDVQKNFGTQASVYAKIREEVKNWRVSSIGTGLGIELERRIKEKSAVSVFEESFINLWKALERMGIDTILLMFDDFHYLADRYPDGLYDIRGIFQGLPRHGCNIILVVSGEKSLFWKIRKLAEPLARFFNIKHTLDLFGYEETKNAITKPIKLSKMDLKLTEEVIERIYNLTGGHPYFIHFIMRELLGLKRRGRISLKFFDDNYKVIKSVVEKEKFGVDFSIASEKEKEILLEIAKLDKDSFSPSDIKIENARTQLKFLVKKELITKLDRGEYSLYHALFKEYLRGIYSGEM